MRPGVSEPTVCLGGKAKGLAGRFRVAPRTESGVALVITLILLSVITFMAVTFLVVSRNEAHSVTTHTDLLIARDAASAGTERAISEIVAPMIAFTNEYSFDMWVSTNYVNPLGFIPGNLNPTNVNFDYTSPGLARLNANETLQNLANLMYAPRVPVYMTNRVLKTNEFRFYYDANRNGIFDPSGAQMVIGTNGLPITFTDTNGTRIVTNSFVGDPQWIGTLERSGYPHSSSNRFIYRTAYIVVPTGRTLDINYIHNYTKVFQPGMPNSRGDGFFRNMGAGTWEMNLASFLVDLNTNFWPYPADNTYQRYIYNTDLQTANAGSSFDDALSLLRYRYDNSYGNLSPVNLMFGNPGSIAFRTDWVDGYTRGPLMIGNWWTPTPTDNDANWVSRPWSGADNPKHFFSPQEIFDKNRIKNTTAGAQSLPDRLMLAGARTNSYDRYTYYRLLSQLGSDSSPEPPDRMNINWDNLVQGHPVTGARSVTNFLQWRPVDFFTNAAQRLLVNAGYGTNVLNKGNFQIQIYPTNFYTPSVHRLLQLAANIYDGTTTNNLPGSTNMGRPSVFRPIFSTGGGSKGGGNPNQISIVGFEEVTDTSIATGQIPIWDLNNPNDRLSLKPRDMVYGVPLVIGAKKGLPNFNEFAMETRMYVTRKLEFRRPVGSTAPPNETNQMYIVGVSNSFAVEGWNSYTNTIQRNLRMLVASDITMLFTNELGMLRSNRFSQSADIRTNFWPGYLARGAFQIPLTNSIAFMPVQTYRHQAPAFIPLSRQFERGLGFPVPHWWVTMSARTRFVVLDEQANRVIDYVNLDSTEDPVDVTVKLFEDGACDVVPSGRIGSQWCTNRLGGTPVTDVRVPTYGIMNQILVGTGRVTPEDWNSFNMDPIIGSDRAKASAGFDYNLNGHETLGYGPYYRSNIFYAPFEPFRVIYQHTTWQANDPLVHYTVGDLMNLEKTNNVDFIPQKPTPLMNIGRINDRYEPWAKGSANSSSVTRYDLSIKDPGVARSDDWQFPTNKLPSIGWLGRIHRGTPWQTVYLKAPIANLDLWRKWTGNGVIVTNWNDAGTTNFDAELSMPFRDRYMLDLFTAAPNDNATRGQLSVNQTNLAAWSAALGGVVALTNVISEADLLNNPYLTPSNAPFIINPAGVYDPFNKQSFPPMVRILEGINNARANTNLFPKKVFTRLGDILSVPELTVGSSYLFPTNYVGVYPNGYWSGASPFLNLGNPASILLHSTSPEDHLTKQQLGQITDAAYERIPQQILGLLRLDQAPRFVIYSYGQALKPAPQSIVTSGPFFGLCTNYLITAEAATRTVVRIDGAPGNPHAVIETFNVLQPD